MRNNSNNIIKGQFITTEKVVKAKQHIHKVLFPVKNECHFNQIRASLSENYCVYSAKYELKSAMFRVGNYN